MSSSLATNPETLQTGRTTHRVLVTGNNKKGFETFKLTSPVRDVETVRLVYAQIPAASDTSTAVSLRLGDRDVEKVQTAVPSRTASSAEESMDPARYYGGKPHFVVVPNGVEVYTPHLRDEVVAFVPPIPVVATVRAELYALPSAQRDLLDLGGDHFAILLEMTATRRP